MSATLKFTEKLEQINRFWIEKITKELEEKQKKQNEEILRTLGLNKMFQDTIKKNELFALLNNSDINDDNELGKKEIMKNVSKTNDIYNKTFDAMDNGNFKPVLLKLFDVAKDEIKDKAKDKAKDTFEDYFADKLQEAKEIGAKDISSVKDVKEIAEKLKDVVEDKNEYSSSTSSSKQTNKPSRNFERLRQRCR